MNSQTRTRKPRLLLLAVAVGVVAFACWPRGPRLEWYTSPAMTFQGETARLKCLIPEGWLKSTKVIISRRAPNMPPLSVYVSLRAPDRSRYLRWIPENLAERFWAKREEIAELELYFGGGPFASDDVETEVSGKVQVEHIARRSIQSGVGCQLVYARSNREEFEATYRQICQSFRVVR